LHKDEWIIVEEL